MYIVYKTTNAVNGKYYIGVHNGNDPYYKGSGRVLKAAIKQYGGRNFKRETLATFTTANEAYAKEAELVSEALVNSRDTYNIATGGQGGPGTPKSEEHKQKIREANLGKKTIGSLNAGRKVATKNIVELCEQHGKRKAAEILGITLEACRHRYYRMKSKY